MVRTKPAKKGEKQMSEECEEVVKVVCDMCGEEVDTDEMDETSDGTEMCKTCLKDEAICFKCDCCSDIYCRDANDPTETSGGDTVCQNCLDNDYFCCEHCNEWHENDDMREAGRGGCVCQHCFDENYAECECGNVGSQDDYTYFNDRYYCSDCYGESLCSCDDCGTTLFRDDAFYENDGDECYCGRCHRRAHANRAIHDYSYQPDYRFFCMEEEKNSKPLYLGLELEVESNGNEDLQPKAKRMIDWMKTEKIDHLYYFKTDGSLENGFEICAMPMTLKYIKKNSKLKQMTEWMKNNGLSSYKKGSCGFHIHMARNFFKNNEIGKMRGFFSSCYLQIFKLSKRGDNNTYAAKENYTWKEFKEGIGQSGRYWALNTNTNKATYEVRIFRGTLNFKRLMASIEFVQAVSEYIKQAGFLSMFQIGKYGGNIWSNFLFWTKRDGRFHQFYTYFMKSCTR
jgi:hypothetical protein